MARTEPRNERQQIRLTPTVLERIDAIAEEVGISRSATLTWLVGTGAARVMAEMNMHQAVATALGDSLATLAEAERINADDDV